MPRTAAHPAGTIYTLGHSTHTLEEVVEMLKAHQVGGIADVRSIPRSRRVPQFNADALEVDLPRHGLAYYPFKDLGGRRHARKDSINSAWRNESFRGYADFMQTEAFSAALARLTDLARKTPLAMMCAEAVPWRCHRSLIGDALLVRGWEVLDIFSCTKVTPHKLTPFARVRGERITYPGETLFAEPPPIQS